MATTVWSGFTDVTVKSSSSYMLVDKDTGETLSDIGFVAEHNITKDSGFEKIWIMQFMSAIGVISNRKIDVVSHVILEAKKFNNVYFGTYQQIHERTGISYTTVAETMKLMITHKLFLQKSQGVYMVNPDILFRGSYSRRMAVVNMWKDGEKDDKKKPREQEIAELKNSIEKLQETLAHSQQRLYRLQQSED